jgi:hypothetical protein
MPIATPDRGRPTPDTVGLAAEASPPVLGYGSITRAPRRMWGWIAFALGVGGCLLSVVAAVAGWKGGVLEYTAVCIFVSLTVAISAFATSTSDDLLEHALGLVGGALALLLLFAAASKM